MARMDIEDMRLPNNVYIHLSYFPYLDKEMSNSEHTRNRFKWSRRLLFLLMQTPFNVYY